MYRAYGEILIITHSYNRPEFIAIQHKTFKNFLKDKDYTFIVFNDAPDNATKESIDAMCRSLKINCIRIPQKIHTYAYLRRWPGEGFNSACVRCANVVQYSLNEVGLHHNDIVVIIDSDMFLVKEFSIREFMHGFDLAGVPQSRNSTVHYIWNGLVFLNMSTLPDKQLINFNCGRVNDIPVDVGGQLHHYLSSHPLLRIQYIDQWYLRYPLSMVTLQEHKLNQATIDFILSEPSNVEFILNKTFLHYRGGTNWDAQSVTYHNRKMKQLMKYIADLLGNNAQEGPVKKVTDRAVHTRHFQKANR